MFLCNYNINILYFLDGMYIWHYLKTLGYKLKFKTGKIFLNLTLNLDSYNYKIFFTIIIDNWKKTSVILREILSMAKINESC